MSEPQQPKLFEWQETWTQESDTNDPAQSGQTIKLVAEDNGAGEGCFLVISTKRWALDEDDIDKFAEMLKRFIQKGNQ